jgi:hypothetical protein
MPRDRANIRTNIWASTDWRRLTKGAQQLYMMLLSHPDLSYAGVCDWRPGRLAQMTSGETSESVTRDADELQRNHFVLRDDVTEEVCIRSFLKHDGLLRHPQLSVSFANAYAAVASPTIREVIAHEAQKLHLSEPSLVAWTKQQVQTILSEPARDLKATAVEHEPAHQLAPQLGASAIRPQGSATTTATTTATEEPLSPAKADDGGHLIPPNWAPNLMHRDKAMSLNIDVDRQATRFVDHANRTMRRLKNWNAGFTNWLKQEAVHAQQRATTTGRAPAPASRLSAVEQNLINYQQRYPRKGDPNDGQAGDRTAIDPGIGH